MKRKMITILDDGGDRIVPVEKPANEVSLSDSIYDEKNNEYSIHTIREGVSLTDHAIVYYAETLQASAGLPR